MEGNGARKLNHLSNLQVKINFLLSEGAFEHGVSLTEKHFLYNLDWKFKLGSKIIINHVIAALVSRAAFLHH